MITISYKMEDKLSFYPVSSVTTKPGYRKMSYTKEIDETIDLIEGKHFVSHKKNFSLGVAKTPKASTLKNFFNNLQGSVLNRNKNFVYRSTHNV